MARIRVYVRQSMRTSAGLARTGEGDLLSVPFLRVYSLMRIGSRAQFAQDCIIDTGAPLTIFPVKQWKHFADDIEWLAPADPSIDSWLSVITGKTGGQRSCRIGRVVAEACDLGPPPTFLPASTVLALFEETPNGDDQILVGLHGGILAGRRLIVEADLGVGYLEEL